MVYVSDIKSDDLTEAEIGGVNTDSKEKISIEENAKGQVWVKFQQTTFSDRVFVYASGYWTNNVYLVNVRRKFMRSIRLL